MTTVATRLACAGLLTATLVALAPGGDPHAAVPAAHGDAREPAAVQVDSRPAADPRLTGFQRFIGTWEFPPELVEANPGAADYIARRWEWGPHGNTVRLGESVHRDDPTRTIFEGFAYWHPTEDRVRFVGYNAQLQFFFEGYYEELGPDRLIRVYTVHYPTGFEHDTYPELTDRVREYRGELRLVEPDVIENRTFMRVGGAWVPWPTADAPPFRIHRGSRSDGGDPNSP